jgi:hypothetical protein
MQVHKIGRGCPRIHSWEEVTHNYQYELMCLSEECSSITVKVYTEIKEACRGYNKSVA